MTIFTQANEMMLQASALSSTGLGEVVGSIFLKLLTFFLNLLLGA